MACFLYFRCWPGFSDGFDFAPFNALSDGEIKPALDRHAKRLIRGNLTTIRHRWGHRARGMGHWRTKREKLFDNVERRNVNGLFPLAVDTKTTAQLREKPDWRAVVRRASGNAPLICKVGAYLGWWSGRHPLYREWGRATSRRFIFAPVADKDSAKYLAGELQKHFDDHPLGVLGPRFGYFDAAQLSNAEREDTPRAIARLESGKITGPETEVQGAVAIVAEAKAFMNPDGEPVATTVVNKERNEPLPNTRKEQGKTSKVPANELEKSVENICRVKADISLRDLAKRTGWPVGTIQGTAAWQNLIGTRKKKRAPRPGRVTFTDKLESTHGQTEEEQTQDEIDERIDEQEQLDQLIAECNADYEPSPLDKSGSSPKTFPRV